MSKPILVKRDLPDRDVLFLERQRNWIRQHLPFEFRRWFIRAFGDIFEEIDSSKMSPELFSKEQINCLDREGLFPEYSPAVTIDEASHRQSGKAVIIIPTYNNLECLRLCLDSIWTKTFYLNYEVCVVDNGSKADTFDYLSMAELQETRLRVIHNKENFGFARACNIGIEAAGQCEYIVLLNDDTIVTRGWLTRLIRHLDDSDIKLVGPVTNWAGNEARIRVDYYDSESLEKFSGEYCQAHEGRFFDIPMLAMYCILMRRSLVDEIGILDERFGIGMFEDDDFSRRVLNSGGRIICAEDVFIHHWGRGAMKKIGRKEFNRLFIENRKKYEQKWQIRWKPHRQRA
jgi:GT2 family glycosyltransferase